MTESAIKAIFIWNSFFLPLQFVAMVVASGAKNMSPFPPWWERLRRTENDPHFGVLNDIQVLTRDSNNSSSTMEQPMKIIVSKKIVTVII